jgi:hypothetical protein
MADSYNKVKEYLNQLNYSVIGENESEGMLIIDNENEGIKNMVLVVDDPIIIMEQMIFKVKGDDVNMYKTLLQKNQDILHGAFVLNQAGDTVIFRDTLQSENIDLNELAGSLNSLSLLMSEFAGQIIKFSA